MYLKNSSVIFLECKINFILITQDMILLYKYNYIIHNIINITPSLHIPQLLVKSWVSDLS